MNSKIYPVILSGGVGSRLWPASREKLPKQFIPITQNQTFFNSTIKRFQFKNFNNITVVGNFEHRFLIYDSIAKTKINPEAVLLEPESKNTLAAITLSALHIHKKDPEATLLVVPSDHLIDSNSKFNNHIKKITKNFFQDFIYIFGVKPNRPSSSFGYIKIGKKKNKFVYDVDKFVEKPDLKKAKVFFNDEKFYWNSGMFLFSTKTLIREMTLYSKKTLELCEKIIKKSGKHYEFTVFPKKLFKSLKNESFDRALMEKTSKAVIAPISFNWSDIGSWSGYWNAFKKDSDGNILDNNVFTEDLKNSIVKINDGSTAIVMGLNNVSIVKEKDALLVINKEYSEKIKDTLRILKRKKNKTVDLHTTEYRPWGSFENIKYGEGFLVKILRIKPGSKISLQYHKRRSEHWVVTKGVATILLEKKEIQLKKSESVYVKIGQKHRISNNTNSIVELVEIQIGDILSEKDIVRIDDIYGRVKKKD